MFFVWTWAEAKSEALYIILSRTGEIAGMIAEDSEIRRKRLRFRAWHRGIREADLMFGGFADRYLAALDEAQLDRFERLLENSDPELYAWLTGREPVPPEYDHDVMALLRTYIGRSETR